MKKENKELRKNLVDNNKNYVEVVNENLSLKAVIEESFSGAKDPNLEVLQGIWDILDATNGSEGFIADLVRNSIASWKAHKQISLSAKDKSYGTPRQKALGALDTWDL